MEDHTAEVIAVNIKIHLDYLGISHTIHAMKEIGERVKGLRVQSGLTQSSLAVKCGMHQSAIAHLESGRRTPTVVVVVRLCTALGCRSDYLLGLPEDRNP